MGCSGFSSACRRLVTGGLLLAGGLASVAWWHLEVPASTAGDRAAAMARWPSAEALLRGVAETRMRYQSLHAELTIDDRTEPFRMTLIVDIADNGRLCRFERLADDDSLGEVVIVDHDELRGFRREPNEEVCLDDAKTALGRYEGLVCEPRLLGLTATHSATGPLEEYLCRDAAHSPVVLGKEELDGSVVWRVQAAGESVVSTFWIEDSTFRVHKRVDTWEDGCCEIWSYFDGDETCPLPSRVHVLTVRSGQDVLQASLAVRKLVLDEKPSAERFALSSMDLPVNTPVVDRRLDRRIGYWNGQGLQDSKE